ncbi:class I SAM-dependent methyltransferase [Desulfobacula toluolica]|uniref:Predicted methyltransferase, type 11 n=1 Tax=Desulfobacula toluolica (strain DSM 7467 / Tol2) TaxID=651182 RepID=K0NII3_DESTT|nr:class I SAM-dependent methyltransferase [Desulfobacula toluolica]CCK79578.1 predicted methyltransferase, type 11 [Desulfobacula toluolica Tol2]
MMDLHRLNEMTNPNKWDNPEWMKIHRELESYSVDKHCFSESKEYAYRKGWEWTQCIWGLHTLGAIDAKAKGLGVGAGHEPILYYLADHIAEVTGTDLYGNENWTNNAIGGNEANPSILENSDEFCDRGYDKSKLQLLNMNGTDLKFDNKTFDFVWSLSSIEHFGGHKKAKESMKEMARVTKKNGIVAVATEFILTPNCKDHPEFFTKELLEKYIINASPQLQLVHEMNYELPSLEYLMDPIMMHLDGDVHRIRHHIILNDGRVQWTSIICFFRKL